MRGWSKIYFVTTTYGEKDNHTGGNTPVLFFPFPFLEGLPAGSKALPAAMPLPCSLLPLEPSQLPLKPLFLSNLGVTLIIPYDRSSLKLCFMFGVALISNAQLDLLRS